MTPKSCRWRRANVFDRRLTAKGLKAYSRPFAANDEHSWTSVDDPADPIFERMRFDRAPDTNALDQKAEMPGWRPRVRLQPPQAQGRVPSFASPSI
jgi:hypothetical protein